VKFKDTRSVSSIDVEVHYSIPMMLRQQQCWKFASARRNFRTLRFRKLCCRNVAFSGSSNTLGAFFKKKKKCVSANWVVTCVGNKQWGKGLFGINNCAASGVASCYTVAVVTPCSL
jgi:hypothetical protein